MTFLPIVLREMSVLSRRRGLYAARFTLALGATLVAGWLLASSLAAVTSAEVGRSLFVVLSSAAFAYAMLAGVHVTSDCLSEEKREDTLGLLFLTDLKGYDIVLGKMAAGSLNAAFALLATVPILALAIFLGGVSLAQIGQITVVLACSIVLSLGAGVLVSSVSQNERKAMFGTLLLLAFLTFGPFLLSILVNDLETKPPEEWILFSPLYPLLCQFSPPGLNTAYFWPAVIVHFALGAASVAAASRVLPRFVNDLPRERFRKIRALAQRMTFGSAVSRKRHRAALLDRNAFLWLAGRERLKSRYAWGLIALFAGVYLWMGLQFPDLVFELPIALVIFFLLHFAFKLWLASEVCSRLIEDRRSGALELLLSTPLTVQQIAHGQTLALRRIFLKPALLMLLAEFALFCNMFGQPRALSSRAEIMLAMFAAPATLLLDFWCLKWVGLWLSLRGKSIERVLVGTTVRVMALPWIVFVALLGAYGAANLFGMRLRIEDHDVFATWIFLSLALPLLFAAPARFRFLRSFRVAATQRFDAPSELKNDPAATEQLPPSVRPPRKRRFTPKRLAWAAALVLFLVLPAARRAWWNARLAEEIRRIEAEGLPTGFQNLAGFYAPVPAREDAAVGIKDAGIPNFTAFGKRPNVFSNFGLAGIAPPETQLWQNVQLTVATNAQILPALHQAVRRPKAFVDPEVNPWRWSYRQDLFAASAILWMEGIAGCANNPAKARECVLDLLRFGRLLQSAPALPAQTAALHTFHRANNLLERVLHAGLAEPAFLQELARELSSAHAPEVLKRILVVRRAMLIDRVRNPVADPFMPRGPMIAAVHGVFDGIGARQKWLSQLLQVSRTGIDSVALPESERLEFYSKLDRSLGNAIFLMPEYIWQSFEMDGVVSLDLAILARVRLMETAVALERHRLENGALPQNSRLPVDPFSGEPLKLKEDKERGMILYSIGQDRKDDGGKLGENYGADLGFIFSPPEPKSR